MGIFDGIFNNDPQKDAAQAQIGGLNSAFDAASGTIGSTNATTNADYGAALAPYTQNYNTFSSGTNNYADAIGANGQSGYDQALQSFHASPGYDYTLNQGLDSALRKGSQAGTLASGGTLVDLTKVGEGVANQDWQQYVQNLLPFVQGAQTSAAGIAGTNVAKAGTDTDLGKTLANLDWSKFTGIGNANANADLSQAGVNANILGAGMNLGKSLVSFL